MIPDITPRATSNCNGVLKSFTFSYPIINSSDLVVFLTEIATGTITTLAETTDYVVADPNGIQSARANYENGGTITTAAAEAYSAAYTITIERSVPYTQNTDYTEGMQTLYESFENGLDKLTMLVQQVKFIADRAPHAPSEDSLLINMEMPNATARANHILGFDAQGDPIAADYGAKVNAAAFVGNDIRFTLTDGSTVTIIGGKTAITGPTGEIGATITAAAWSANDMVFTKSDLSIVTLVNAKVDLKGETGATGAKGDQGNAGADAAEIVSVAWDTNDMKFTKDDATTFSLTNAKVDLKGETGAKGDTGSQGPQGDEGPQGPAGSNGTNGLNGAPIGAVIEWMTETAPADFLECDGASLVRATYANLFAIIGTMYGTADATHFNLPDLRGRFPRGWAHGSANDPDRASRTVPGAAGATLSAGDHVGTGQTYDTKAHVHAITTSSEGGEGGVITRSYTGGSGQNTTTWPASGGSETRPINTAVMFCIKYQ